MANGERAWTRDEMQDELMEILRDKVIRQDSDFAGTVTEDTRIVGDLELESVAIVEFCMAVGKHFQKKLPFQELVFRDGQFQDFTVRELVTFLERHLSSRANQSSQTSSF